MLTALMPQQALYRGASRQVTRQHCVNVSICIFFFLTTCFSKIQKKQKGSKQLPSNVKRFTVKLHFFFFTTVEKVWYITHEQLPALGSLQLNHNHGSAKTMDSSGQQLLQHARVSAAGTDQMSTMVRLPSQIWTTICLVFQTQQNSKEQILKPLIFKAFFFFVFFFKLPGKSCTVKMKRNANTFLCP